MCFTLRDEFGFQSCQVSEKSCVCMPQSPARLCSCDTNLSREVAINPPNLLQFELCGEGETPPLISVMLHCVVGLADCRYFCHERNIYLVAKL